MAKRRAALRIQRYNPTEVSEWQFAPNDVSCPGSTRLMASPKPRDDGLDGRTEKRARNKNVSGRVRWKTVAGSVGDGRGGENTEGKRRSYAERRTQNASSVGRECRKDSRLSVEPLAVGTLCRRGRLLARADSLEMEGGISDSIRLEEPT